ncbi:MAG: phenylacetate-CoA oxygenase subunit PaaJ [Flavobacteriales bacterium]|jgi:ring-1,2-phenylacetyl-CoA epoxidase subunit PaaD|nr:phenylacetate-CoA oxygenase subunit PaaJ [Flavobacteriales bacterium]MBP9160634.1 phenylacetate-CoA oxygenase subunit PaaJ [Flavobacteriales bacterium]MCI1753923.1 phenylacetate-CoA oxygenase subunit PaaJ [Flavobacteriales bacterium]
MRTEAEIRDLLEQVKDPEIPVISIRELGVLREVTVNGDRVEVTITPTYSGCPAMDVMREDVEKALREAGVERFTVKQVLSPAWTTDWISVSGKKKLMDYGIAPPPHTSDIRALKGGVPVTTCPQCGSTDTVLVSHFGSTACKALYKCNACQEPFDLFKCL